jgi:hypothetical protein
MSVDSAGLRVFCATRQPIEQLFRASALYPAIGMIGRNGVLDQDYLYVVDVEEIGCAAIGIEFLLVDLKSDSSWIGVAFGSIIDRAHDALTLREFPPQ